GIIDPVAQANVLGTAVRLAAAGHSGGVTTAMTYELASARPFATKRRAPVKTRSLSIRSASAAIAPGIGRHHSPPPADRPPIQALSSAQCGYDPIGYPAPW